MPSSSCDGCPLQGMWGSTVRAGAPHQTVHGRDRLTRTWGLGARASAAPFFAGSGRMMPGRASRWSPGRPDHHPDHQPPGEAARCQPSRLRGNATMAHLPESKGAWRADRRLLRIFAAAGREVGVLASTMAMRPSLARALIKAGLAPTVVAAWPYAGPTSKVSTSTPT
jgi:hypothetical protein